MNCPWDQGLSCIELEGGQGILDGYSVYGSDCKHSLVEAEVLKMKILIRMVFLYLLCSMVAQCVLCSLWRTHTGAEEKCERKEAAEGKLLGTVLESGMNEKPGREIVFLSVRRLYRVLGRNVEVKVISKRAKFLRK